MTDIDVTDLASDAKYGLYGAGFAASVVSEAGDDLEVAEAAKVNGEVVSEFRKKHPHPAIEIALSFMASRAIHSTGLAAAASVSGPGTFVALAAVGIGSIWVSKGINAATRQFSKSDFPAEAEKDLWARSGEHLRELWASAKDAGRYIASEPGSRADMKAAGSVTAALIQRMEAMSTREKVVGAAFGVAAVAATFAVGHELAHHVIEPAIEGYVDLGKEIADTIGPDHMTEVYQAAVLTVFAAAEAITLRDSVALAARSGLAWGMSKLSRDSMGPIGLALGQTIKGACFMFDTGRAAGAAVSVAYHAGVEAAQNASNQVLNSAKSIPGAIRQKASGLGDFIGSGIGGILREAKRDPARFDPPGADGEKDKDKDKPSSMGM